MVVAMGRRAAKIAARKGKSDAIKAKLYGKYGKRIQQLVKTGGDDPTKNIALADLIDEAKSARVPRDIIDRNIGEPTAYSALHLAARAPVSRTTDTHASSHPRGGGPPRGPQSGPGGGPWGGRPGAPARCSQARVRTRTPSTRRSCTRRTAPGARGS